MPALGDPPNYSTGRTLGLALASILGALTHFGLGALEYAGVSRYLGLGTMLLAGLLLVFGVLTLIRYAEARDAMTDPLPRTPMYATPHEWATFWAGTGLNGAAALAALAWVAAQQWPAWHLAAAGVNAYAVWLAWKGKPSGRDG